MCSSTSFLSEVVDEAIVMLNYSLNRRNKTQIIKFKFDLFTQKKGEDKYKNFNISNHENTLRKLKI